MSRSESSQAFRLLSGTILSPRQPTTVDFHASGSAGKKGTGKYSSPMVKVDEGTTPTAKDHANDEAKLTYREKCSSSKAGTGYGKKHEHDGRTVFAQSFESFGCNGKTSSSEINDVTTRPRDR